MLPYQRISSAVFLRALRLAQQRKQQGAVRRLLSDSLSRSHPQVDTLLAESALSQGRIDDLERHISQIIARQGAVSGHLCYRMLKGPLRTRTSSRPELKTARQRAQRLALKLHQAGCIRSRTSQESVKLEISLRALAYACASGEEKDVCYRRALEILPCQEKYHAVLLMKYLLEDISTEDTAEPIKGALKIITDIIHRQAEVIPDHVIFKSICRILRPRRGRIRLVLKLIDIYNLRGWPLCAKSYLLSLHIAQDVRCQSAWTRLLKSWPASSPLTDYSDVMTLKRYWTWGQGRGWLESEASVEKWLADRLFPDSKSPSLWSE